MKKVLKNLMLVMVMTLLCMAVAVTADAASSGDYIYEVVNGEATITGYTGNGGVVTVPSTLDGYTVTAIGDYAFSTMDADETVQLPAYKITGITLPDTVKTIGAGAFMRFNISYYLRTLLNVQDYSFNEVEDVSLFIPDSVETIGDAAFVCTEMKGSNEKYTDLKINIFYGGTEAQWKAVYSDDNITREETFVDIEDETGSSIDTVIGDRIDTATYTDKNTVEYNCSCIGHIWKVTDRTYNECQDGNTIEYICTVCGETKTETVAPKDHNLWNYPTDEELSTFCGERDFWVECEYCSYGEYVCLDGTAEHTWDETDSSEEPTCGDPGFIEYECEICYEWYRETIPATGEHEWYWVSNNDATCTEDGTKNKCCRNCEADDVETVTDIGSALGHDYNAKWTVLTEATCTYPGISVRACKRCADIESKTEASYGHFDNDEDGKCDECKVIIEIYAPNDPSIPAEPPVYPGEPDDTHTEHTYGEWTEKDGIMYRVCTGCGNVETKDIDQVTPDTPEDPSKDCSCNCHKTGIMGIIWKILRFFYKLFRINPVCACGIAHY
ncbi:MAG: leucine-rich repeat protein [Clostridia bacterium]|nr:leucine-rich repeat protein [Clostridia bacterium]